MTSQHLIIDCDPGCDDALALLMAFDANFDSIEILTVAGNVGVNQTTANACRIAYFAPEEQNLAIYKGCAMSMDGIRPSAASVHGRDGLGDVPDGVFLKTTEDKDKHESSFKKNYRPNSKAVLRYHEIYKEESTDCNRMLVCTGPLTNLAAFLIHLGVDEHLAFWNKWKRVVLMAGALQVQGNISYHGEFNAYADPLALKIVLDSIRKAQKNGFDNKVILVTLDITEKLNLLWDELKEIFEEGKTRIHDKERFTFVSCMLQKYFLFHGLFANQVSIWCQCQKKVVDLTPHPPPEECAKCSVKSEAACEDVNAYRLMKRKEFEVKRLLGSAGLKSIPRFCQLHDPLALYAAITEDIPVEEAYIYATGELGTARGRIQRIEPRPFFLEEKDASSMTNNTTQVGVIVAEKFMTAHKKTFLKKLKHAIGIDMAND